MFLEYVVTVLVLWMMFAFGAGMVVDHYAQRPQPAKPEGALRARGQGARASVGRAAGVQPPTSECADSEVSIELPPRYVVYNGWQSRDTPLFPGYNQQRQGTVSVMVSTSPARIRGAAARQVMVSSPAQAQSSRATMVAACYAGIVMLVALAVLATKVWPTGLVAVGFVISMVALVAGLHPSLRASFRAR